MDYVIYYVVNKSTKTPCYEGKMEIGEVTNRRKILKDSWASTNSLQKITYILAICLH